MVAPGRCADALDVSSMHLVRDELPALPGDLTLGPVHLTVRELDRSVAFYEQAIGLRLRRRDGDIAVLGTAADDLVVLHADPDARPAGRHAGLYHVALLFPTREELARALQRLAATRTQIQGASDHGVSEAVYLPDPDGNGIELYADRPRPAWPAPSAAGQRVGMYTIALDVHALLDLVAGEDLAPHAADGLRIGHVHLHVGDVQQAVGFYADILGFEVMVDLPSASFLAAGGYHHHLGVNVWRGDGVSAPPPHSAGLAEWHVVLPSAADVTAARARVEAAGVPAADRDGGFLARDPWDTQVVVTARG
jgi:catechol 2,3-dioxygenase